MIAGAALDVLETEPISKNNPLIRRDNVLITPHSAFYSAASLLDLQILTARGAAQVLRGEKPDYLVNPGVHPGVGPSAVGGSDPDASGRRTP